ncbi:nitrogen regulation protein NR(II) [Simiduia curdlanivorans]|uniref:Sensory histidine kinase/phosphatase NtrB n=1 Tax=Simiduia curdlanivorans TaxID=1492769 RepID=A0ABV8V5Z4_9GAMM|nr:nitrogen regulation protein NR(II) [Simiduia curdlanivorans]MDN3637403.1 nitrogen regulation protein NR(II) [Simiduia curdlanivorans]
MTKSELSFITLLDNLNTAVVVTDTNLRIQYINPAAEVLLAVSGERVEGAQLVNFVHESEAALKDLQEALSEQHQFTRRRAEWTLGSGTHLTVDYTVTPINHPVGLLIEIQPLDRLLRISREEAILSAQDTSRNLVRGMAHEIKNPLGGIRGAAQLLARELEDGDLKEYTQVIIDEADRLRNLVDRMLGPRQPPTFAPINIHQVLERVCVLVGVESGGRVAISRDYDPSIPDLPGDAEQLVQATLNVVRNAMQALQENNVTDGHIALRTRIQRQFTIGRSHHNLICRIDVIDNGPGIAPEIIEDIFYPMISGRAEGTGLGLAIALQLINQHHGLIECESRPGQTQFTIYIPMEQPKAEQPNAKN